MPLFAYLALNSAGAERRGTFEATDARAAAEQLRGQRLHVLRLDPAERTRTAGTGLILKRPLSERARQGLLRQLGVLLGAGLTLVRALETLEGSSAPKAVRRVAGELREAVRGGASFSEALTRQHGLLEEGGLERVASAELTGELDRALVAIADESERSRRMRSKLRSAMAYPAVILAIAAAVTGLLVIFVVPRFAQFFAHSGRPLPPMLSYLVRVSEIAVAALPVLLLGLWLILLLLWLVRRQPAGREATDRLALRLPLIGWLLARHALWRATQSMAGLLSAGIGILTALRVTARNTGNAALGAVFERASERVLAGRGVAASLEDPMVPDELRHVVAVGEQSGELSAVLAQLAQHYENQVDRAIERLAATSEPVLLLLVGAIVGGIYISFFQAIFRIVGG